MESNGGHLQCEWNTDKAARNVAKHGISFESAVTVFGDPLALTIDDPDHSQDEARFLTLGRSSEGTVLMVSHTGRGDRIRLISARKASRKERKVYSE